MDRLLRRWLCPLAGLAGRPFSDMLRAGLSLMRDAGAAVLTGWT